MSEIIIQIIEYMARFMPEWVAGKSLDFMARAALWLLSAVWRRWGAALMRKTTDWVRLHLDAIGKADVMARHARR
ncbi:hypothetical protein [Bifidobacterium erythrocebi]|nr:hypothetical protein [Bifidobacterium sp. DSM 109960]